MEGEEEGCGLTKEGYAACEMSVREEEEERAL